MAAILLALASPELEILGYVISFGRLFLTFRALLILETDENWSLQATLTQLRLSSVVFLYDSIHVFI